MFALIVETHTVGADTVQKQVQELIPRETITFDTIPLKDMPLLTEGVALTFTINVILLHDCVETCLASFICRLDVDNVQGTIKRIEQHVKGVRLTVEYARSRVGESRCKEDAVWKWVQGSIEFQQVPVLLLSTGRYLETVYACQRAEQQKHETQQDIQRYMAKEQDLKLQLLDVKCMLNEARKELQHRERNLIKAKETMDNERSNVEV